jgi:hypothetical protein
MQPMCDKFPFLGVFHQLSPTIAAQKIAVNPRGSMQRDHIVLIKSLQLHKTPMFVRFSANRYGEG